MNTIIEFLAGLEAHNDRDWYVSHQSDRLSAEAQFVSLVASIQDAVAAFVPSVGNYDPKTLTFRLQRDTRYAKDKSPYNPAFRAHLGPAGKLPIPMGPYLQIRPGGRSFLGGGLFAAMFPEATSMVRYTIISDPDQWQALTATLPWPIQGEMLKNVPRGLPVDHPCAEDLKHKSWYLEVPLTDADLLDQAFVARAAEVYKQAQPLNDYLNQALADFSMPTR